MSWAASLFAAWPVTAQSFATQSLAGEPLAAQPIAVIPSEARNSSWLLQAAQKKEGFLASLGMTAIFSRK
jgi:hypothetical protein